MWDLNIKFTEEQNMSRHNAEFFGTWNFIEGLCIFGWVITVLSFFAFAKAWNRDPDNDVVDPCGDCEEESFPPM